MLQLLLRRVRAAAVVVGSLNLPLGEHGVGFNKIKEILEELSKIIIGYCPTNAMVVSLYQDS